MGYPQYEFRFGYDIPFNELAEKINGAQSIINLSETEKYDEFPAYEGNILFYGVKISCTLWGMPDVVEDEMIEGYELIVTFFDESCRDWYQIFINQLRDALRGIDIEEEGWRSLSGKLVKSCRELFAPK